MRRRDKAGGKAAKVLRSKTLKRRNAPKTALRSSSFAPEKVTDVARLTRERDEARWSSWQLLHSREGLGEHRLADINAIVEESLNLAHHGARAEKQGFNIILERLLDPAAGEVDVFPQEITRALLNLISNGFTRRSNARWTRMEATASRRLLPPPRILATASKSRSATTAPAFRPR